MPKIIGEVTENGCRRIAVRFEQPDGSGVEDFVDLPADDERINSDAWVEQEITKGIARLEAKHAPKAAAEPDAVSRVLEKLAGGARRPTKRGGGG